MVRRFSNKTYNKSLLPYSEQKSRSIELNESPLHVNQFFKNYIHDACNFYVSLNESGDHKLEENKNTR